MLSTRQVITHPSEATTRQAALDAGHSFVKVEGVMEDGHRVEFDMIHFAGEGEHFLPERARDAFLAYGLHNVVEFKINI